MDRKTNKQSINKHRVSLINGEKEKEADRKRQKYRARGKRRVKGRLRQKQWECARKKKEREV